MRSNNFELKKQDKLVVGCGTACTDSIIVEGVWSNKIKHIEVHPPSEFLTMDLPGSKYKPDIECNLNDPKLNNFFPNVSFSQIILEHLPPIAINKQAIINLSYLLNDQGVCLAVLSKYLGRSIAHIGIDFHTGSLNKIDKLTTDLNRYQRGDYEFFHNLQIAGFKTILFLDDTGLNFVLFKVDVMKAQEIFDNLVKSNDYFSKVCKRKILIKGDSNCPIWGSIDNIVLKSKIFISNFIKNSSQEIKDIIELSNHNSAKDINIIDTMGILGSKNLLEPSILNEFLYNYNTSFQYLLLSKNNIASLFNILNQINQERNSFSYNLFSIIKIAGNSVTDLEYVFVTNLIKNLLYFSLTTYEGILHASLDIKIRNEDVCELIYVRFRKEIRDCLISMLGNENKLQILLNEMLRTNIANFHL
ncbi:hypothetical protein ACQUW5_14200 [Legionella sp. CNM-1927-20]|uniref:hypothetical protein n=1 Tax=Legionella sp. CNM-1927-20 TaxID=3422221 RepID=UPI00403A8EB4